MKSRPGDKIDIPVDTSEAEHVLILEITAVAPLINLHGHDIASLHHIFGDVKLGVVVGPLAISDLLSVDPEIEGGVNAVEVDVHLLVTPI